VQAEGRSLGRVAAHEIMLGTPAIRNLIRENKVAQMYSAIQTGQAWACRRWTKPDRPGAPQHHQLGRGAGQREDPGELPR
jgi:hypothetical protein